MFFIINHLRLSTLLSLLLIIALPWIGECKLPELTPQIVKTKINEITKAHASYKKLTPELVHRALNNYLEQLDPAKSYFIESDIAQWLSPSDDLLNAILEDLSQGHYTTFEQIHQAMTPVIQRRHELEKQIVVADLPKRVSSEEFKDMKWTANDQELLTRLVRIKALQLEAASKLAEEVKEKSLQRIAKRQAKYEEDILNPDPVHHEHLVLSNVLKAIASSLDTHTAYFTPDEAAEFMNNVQQSQRVFGIGAQLRDDINGFTIVKIVEGGPAATGKELKVKDRIIAVDGEPVVGMEITDAVTLIRGPEHTPVTLTIIREGQENGKKKEEKLDIVVLRGEVVLKETRYETSYEPFGNGVIGYLRLYSFYQDPDSSSASDLTHEIEKLTSEHNVKGLVLDLRYNSGGLLTQAVDVAGLFITKGVVVSIKDETGTIQHLRDLEGKAVWNGHLAVLVNRASASASEIVAGTLQDYGRALIIGDDHTYGKGSFQTFTLNNGPNSEVNPEGEYKVTRGLYYTVSGRTPQLDGVGSDIVIPGSLSELDVGEKFSKYPLKGDFIPDSFDDDLLDIPFFQRDKVRKLYKFDLQPRLTTYHPYLDTLRINSSQRIELNKNYQNFLKEIKKTDDFAESEENPFGQNDLQLTEAIDIVKDLLMLMH